MKAAIYPGTFDPPTLGHLNIIERASRHFDKLVVAIGENPLKPSPAFTPEERIHLLKQIVPPRVEVTSFTGLLVDFAESQNISIVIRAIRSTLDFENETLQAQMNRHISSLETFFLVVDDQYRSLSSSLIREIASHGKPLTHFVPPAIESLILHKFNQ